MALLVLLVKLCAGSMESKHYTFWSNMVQNKDQSVIQIPQMIMTVVMFSVIIRYQQLCYDRILIRDRELHNKHDSNDNGCDSSFPHCPCNVTWTRWLPYHRNWCQSTCPSHYESLTLPFPYLPSTDREDQSILCTWVAGLYHCGCYVETEGP